MVVIAIAGALNLPYPFKGDQALFAVGVKVLANGGVLYRDFWDLKQPGIYWFYHLASTVFGNTEIGIHFAELIWFMVLALMISLFLRGRFALPWMSDVCALLTVGVYFAVCGVWHLTQLEGLVSLPLFGCFLMAGSQDRTEKKSFGQLFCFGAMVGVIAIFKIILVAIPITLLLISALADIKALFRYLLISIAGAACVIVPVILYFHALNQLPLMFKTFFVYPPRIFHEVPMNGLKVLLHGSRWFAGAAGPLLVFGCLGIFFRFRKSFSRFTIAIVVWIVVAGILVLIQRMWWEYHFLLVLFPLGILATIGLEESILCLRSKNYPSALTGLLLAIAVGPFALRSVHKAVNEARHCGLENFRLFVSPDYANAALESKWLSSESNRSGDVYILGDPLINFLSGRNQTVSLNGWSPEWFLPEQWLQLSNEIETKHPRYVFVANDSQRLLQKRGEQFTLILNRDYLPARQSEIGEWFILKGF